MTPLASPVGDPAILKPPGAFDLVVHFLEWEKYRLWNKCVKMCPKHLPGQKTYGEG